MSAPRRVLVTGSAGRIGRAVVRELIVRGHDVTGYDLHPTPGLPGPKSVIASLLDPDALERSLTGVKCLIHLAATSDDSRFPRGPAPDDGDNFLSELVPNNLIGPYRVMEAARRASVPRVILASTGQVVDGYLGEGAVPVTTGMVPKPRYHYACTKIFLEALGRVYATQHSISVLIARLGWCPRDSVQFDELRLSSLGQDVYLSPGDAGRFFASAVDMDEPPRFAVVFVTSRPAQLLRYDLEPARKLVGYEPQDRWPTGADGF